MRGDLSGYPTYRELLGRVRTAALGALDHQDLPFERLVQELQPERDLSRTPLFQVMFAFQNVPATTLELPGLTHEALDVDNGTSKFDLTLFVTERPDGVLCTFEYNTDLFDGETAGRMLGHYRTLLEGIAADPARRVSELPLLTEAERHQMLVAWNDTAVAYPAGETLHGLFEAQAARTPGALALVGEGERLTYRELDGRANRLAHHLRGLGVGRGTLVGICVERSVEMVVGLLGILKAGGAYVPLDPAYPAERLAFMLEDTAAPVLLTQRRLLPGLPEHGARVVLLDAEARRAAPGRATSPTSSTHRARPAGRKGSRSSTTAR
jgi:non-ribosomal peptide synthetase component F